jgi:hypothetical protein
MRVGINGDCDNVWMEVVVMIRVNVFLGYLRTLFILQFLYSVDRFWGKGHEW